MNRFKKLSRALIVAAFLSVTFAPAAFAVECDQDKDGYMALTQDMLEVVIADNAYQTNGDYPPEQWSSVYETYKIGLESDAGLNERYVCDGYKFKKGVEPLRCDQIALGAGSGVFDTARVSTLSGSKVNPGTFDTPDNGIDENCDGIDGKLITGNAGGKDLGNLVERGITMLGRAVAIISVAILIWGGIMYATAAGDEQKVGKARKAIIGAIIGLLVGLLAPSIVNFITTSLA